MAQSFALPIEWPAQFWKSMKCEADTDEYRRAREKAVGEVYALRRGRPIVAVSGSGNSDHNHKTEACHLGRLLASLALNATNGGLAGVMFDVTYGYIHPDGGVAPAWEANDKEAGRAIRIIPKGKKDEADRLGQLLPGAKSVYTDLSGAGAKHIGPNSRNHVLIATADFVICMPGTEGSIAEAMLAKQVYKKPVIAYMPVGGTRKEWHNAVEGFGIHTVQKIEDVAACLHRKLAQLSL